MKLKETAEKAWPQYGDLYFYADDNKVIWHYWQNNEADKKFQKNYGIFRTREEVELELLRRESIHAPKWTPTHGKSIWVYDCSCDLAVNHSWSESYYADWWIGNIKKSRKMSLAWGNKYGKAFKVKR